MRRVLLFLLLSLATIPPCPAQIQLFVRNQPFSGDLRSVFGELYAPLDDLLEALGCNWRVYADGYLWLSFDERREAGKPPLKEFHRLLLEGRAVQVGQQMYANRVYVNVQQLAYAVGSPFRLQTNANTADMLGPTLLPTQLEGVMRGSPESSSGAIALERMETAVQADRLSGYVSVRNKTDQPVRSLVVRVTVRSAKGPLGRMAVRVPRLNAKTVFNWQMPQWTNLADPGAELKVRVDWDYLP